MEQAAPTKAEFLELRSWAGRIYLALTDLQKEKDALNTRVEVLEHFIRERFPEYFAGEVGTEIDPDIKPIEIVFGEPQERLNEKTQQWERRNGDTGEWEQQ